MKPPHRIILAKIINPARRWRPAKKNKFFASKEKVKKNFRRGGGEGMFLFRQEKKLGGEGGETNGMVDGRS